MEQIELWRARILECRDSKLSIKKWCQLHDLKDPTYHYWRKKITAMELEKEATDVSFIEVPLEKLQAIETIEEKPNLSITCNQCQVNISSAEEAKLAAIFFRQLMKLC